MYKIFYGSQMRGTFAKDMNLITLYQQNETGDCSTLQFADGEMLPSYNESIRSIDVFIIQSTNAPADNLMELLMMIDAAKRASAKSINVVIPYFGYARQDRKDRPRVPITAKLVAQLLEVAGADRILTVDLHADQIQGFFNIPVDNLQASSLFVPYIKQHYSDEEYVIASPDVGGSKRIEFYAKKLHVPFVLCHKHRDAPNSIEDMRLIGEDLVKNKHVILIDDMIDTGGTIIKAAELLKKKGAYDISVFATHPVLSNNAIEKLYNSKINELVTTSTLPSVYDISDKYSQFITVLPIQRLLADAIRNIILGDSVSKLFI